MSIFIIIIGILTLVQLFVAKFSLWWILCLVSRILFSTRIIGTQVKFKTLCIIEGLSLGCFLLWNFVFKVPVEGWLRLLGSLVITIIVLAVMFIDNILYVYVVEDAEEE